MRPTGASVCLQTRAQAVVDSGTSSSSLEQLRVPRGEGLQSLAMSETLPPHLCGLQQTALYRHWRCGELSSNTSDAWTEASACLPVVDGGTSSSSLEQLRVPRGAGLQNSAMSETLPPHLRGLQQTAVPVLAQHGVVIAHEWRLVVIRAQAAHVVAGARLQEVTQFVELVTKDGEQCVKRASVLHLCVCLGHGLRLQIPLRSRTPHARRCWLSPGTGPRRDGVRPNSFARAGRCRGTPSHARCATPKQNESRPRAPRAWTVLASATLQRSSTKPM